MQKGVFQMLKLSEQVHVLQLPMVIRGQENTIHPTLLLDAQHGATLVDTGVPGSKTKIEQELSSIGLHLADLKNILLTHQDLDHVGSLSDLLKDHPAHTLAHQIEIPYINGTQRPIKFPTEQMFENVPGLREAMDRYVYPQIAEGLQDGQVLNIAGGVQVVFTPGHTPGHISLYLPKDRILIAGDALTAQGGTLNMPMPSATPDYETARASVRKLAELDVQTIVCYHGGLVTENANEQLQRLAQSTLETQA